MQAVLPRRSTQRSTAFIEVSSRSSMESSGISSPESSTNSYLHSPPGGAPHLFNTNSGAIPTGIVAPNMQGDATGLQTQPPQQQDQLHYPQLPPHHRSNSAPSGAVANAPLGVENAFYSGTPASSNNQTLYIHVPSNANSNGSGGEGGVDVNGEAVSSLHSPTETHQDFWVTVPWQKIAHKLLEHPNLLLGLVATLKSSPVMKNRALRLLASGSGNLSDGGPGQGDFNYPSSPSMNTANIALFSPVEGASVWNSPSEFATSAPFNGGMPGTPMMSGIPDSGQSSASSPSSTAYSTPWGSFPPQQFDGLSLAPAPSLNESSQGYSTQLSPTGSLFNQFPSVVTAPQDTVDPSILQQVETNRKTEEYIWSPVDASLYELGNSRAIQASQLPGAVKMIFPPHTMILAWEKDGSAASPAFRPLHPHSNQWLKAQVCNHRCAYRAGTSSLKRPITIRDHFRKCVYLDEHHPLKVLCSLELAAHERASQGLLPTRRRTRGTGRLSVVKSESSSSPAPGHGVNGRSRAYSAARGSISSTSGGISGREGDSTDSDDDYVPPRSVASNNMLSASSVNTSSSATPSAIAPATTSGHITATGSAANSDTEMTTPFSPEKAPRSLRGITSIADASAPMPSFMTHARRHTMPEARLIFGGQGDLPSSQDNNDMDTFDNTPMPTSNELPLHIPMLHSLSSGASGQEHVTGPFSSFGGIFSTLVQGDSSSSSFGSDDEEAKPAFH